MEPAEVRGDNGEGSGEAKPDVMNDPAYDTNVKGKQKSMDDLDTCRICRGEGSREEPLFYPCKCSGSIKFVHQNCLMEWLSHSQKKHCELCKTPFRFTKLYHPHMPRTVPLPIFLRQAAVHTWKNFLTWSRFLLVVFVWLAWLPWSMRTIWRGLFWIGDGGWVDWKDRRLRNESTNYSISNEVVANDTSPINQSLLVSSDVAASAVISQFMNNISQLLSPIWRVFNFKITTGEPLGLKLLKRLYYIAIRRGSNESSFSTPPTNNATGHSGPSPRSSSWLSDFQFLKSLTSSTRVNNLVIDTLEGVLITLFVVTAFILVFLIREWVVQQQPNLNGGLDVDIAAGQNAEVRPPQQLAEQRQQDPRGEAAAGAGAADEGIQAQRPRARIIARARPRRPGQPRRPSEQGEDLPSEATAEGSETEGAENSHSLSLQRSQDDQDNDLPAEHSSAASQRPAMPDRDTLARAAEIRRTIEEQSGVCEDQNMPMDVFRDLWSRGENKPSGVLRIIEDEGRNDELSWLVIAMKKLEDTSPANDCQEPAVPPGRDPTISGMHNSEHADNANGNSGSVNADAGSVNADASSNGDQMGDDEGFVILDPPSLMSSQRAEIEHRAKVGNPRKLSQETTDQILEWSSGLESPARAFPADVGPQALGNDAQDTSMSPNPNSQTPKRTGAEKHCPETQPTDSQFDNADPSDGSLDPGHNNPFHPDYTGDLPETSTASNTAKVGDVVYKVSEADPPNATPAYSSHGSPQDDPTPDALEHSRGLVETVTNWLWGGVVLSTDQPEEPAGDDEHVVNEIADEAPFVPVAHGQPLMPAANDAEAPAQDPDVVAAALQAGIDPNEVEAVDDIEDLEGIMELVGMQGPLAGLVQNGMFCAVLVSLTILFAVWVPYVSGKLFLIILAHPVSLLVKLPLRWASSGADMIIDFSTFAAGCAFYWIDTIINMICSPLGWLIPPLGRLSRNRILAEMARTYAENALERLGKTFIAAGGNLTEYDIPVFSAVAHESLFIIEMHLAGLLQTISGYIGEGSKVLYHSGGFFEAGKLIEIGIPYYANVLVSFVVEQCLSILSLLPSLLRINPLRVNLNIPRRTIPLDYGLAEWSATDRTLAIAFGYLFFAVLGVIYLNLRATIRGTNKAGRVDGGLADILYQAGGVLKVVLIISIEMIVFPLYCGLLLDVALLPLFGNATIMSRVDFTFTSPYTSVFVHWFVGTCYMFHFALFVSMCRRIMRSGVLYFIRDPDDPTFHPVREVLERSVSTQLWKISFSALVYGGLVIVCLGGVVWGIAYAFEGLLPIHWSSNEPVLEFPVDLLFYNFLMPLAVKFFKPSKGLNKMYGWWFRKCARALRLTNFLFAEKMEDEEGRHVRRTWTDVFKRRQGDSRKPTISEDQQVLVEDKGLANYFLRDGRYVRAPASDQVRIPKGAQTFLEVDEDNRRVDGQPESEEGLHGQKNDMFTKVYVPPLFRLRISIFIFLIWLFAATTGVSITIVPLTLGRFIFAKLTPNHLRMNDIYAFSIGMYILGGALYAAVNHHRIFTYIRESLTPHATTISTFFRKTAFLSLRLSSLFYTYAAFAIVLPALFSIIMEFYLIIPLHTYFSTTFTAINSIHPERHIIHLIQDWTLGVLYLKMAARLILWNTPSRPASALRGIIRNGWLNPDVRLATRGFIFPACLAMGVALTAPLALGWLANNTLLQLYSANDETFRACVYRYSYPGVLALACAGGFLTLLAKAFGGWRKRVRDEVYLIGERLHNFGESKRRSGKGKGKRVVGRT